MARIHRRTVQRDLNDPDNHNGVITYLKPDILECDFKWALGSITMDKANGDDRIPAELFQLLKDNAVKVLHSICQQIWKIQQRPQDWKMSVSIPIPKKGNAKEYLKYCTTVLRKESWAPKNWCFWTVVLEKTLESPLDCKEIQPVHPEDQSWVFIRRTGVEAETLILWPPHAKSWLIGKDPDAGRDWGQEEEGTTEDEMAGWHHRLNGHEFD